MNFRMSDPIFDLQFRLIVIGDTTVGKSSLLHYFTDGKFSEIQDPTIGVDFIARLVQINGTRIKLQLWDTAGQERFKSITKSYYRNSVGVLLVYDVTNPESFRKTPVWMAEANRHILPYKPVFILVGCKSDLARTRDNSSESVVVSQDEAARLAEELGIKSVQTSSKTGENVEEAFRIITEDIYAKVLSGDIPSDDEHWDGVKKGYNSGARGTDLLEAETVSKCC